MPKGTRDQASREADGRYASLRAHIEHHGRDYVLKEYMQIALEGIVSTHKALLAWAAETDAAHKSAYVTALEAADWMQSAILAAMRLDNGHGG